MVLQNAGFKKPQGRGAWCWGWWSSSRGQWGGGRTGFSYSGYTHTRKTGSAVAAGGAIQENTEKRDDSSEMRIKTSMENDTIDSKYGFDRIKDATERVGWLLNMHSTEVLDEDKRLVSAVDYYFIQEDGTRFKSTLTYHPYFYVLPKSGTEKEVALFLQKKYSGYLVGSEAVAKENLI